jgi:hypothetical protein
MKNLKLGRKEGRKVVKLAGLILFGVRTSGREETESVNKTEVL